MIRVDPLIKNIRIEGHRHTRTLTCPYCRDLVKVTLVNHLRRRHPLKWEEWTEGFLAVYNETNDLKRVMRAYSNREGQLVLSWTVIDRELKRKVEGQQRRPLFRPKQAIPQWEPSTSEYSRFTTTLWDVPLRGTWAVHQPTYRGNWAPQIPRALLETYTRPGDLVLDPFVGGGTTLIEAVLLGRNAIGYDVSSFALELTNARLQELSRSADRHSLYGLPQVNVEARFGDARILEGITAASIDFVCTHPPYGDALQYSHNDTADLSLIKDPRLFLEALEACGRRFFQVLKPSAVCALLIGDLRHAGILHPFGFETFARFQAIGFIGENIIIKSQNKDRSTEFYFRDSPLSLRLAHEYLLVFRKPGLRSKEPSDD